MVLVPSSLPPSPPFPPFSSLESEGRRREGEGEEGEGEEGEGEEEAPSHLFDGQHHDGDNDRHSNAGQHSESAGTNELVRILQGLLEGADGKQSQVLLLFSISNQVDVN